MKQLTTEYLSKWGKILKQVAEQNTDIGCETSMIRFIAEVIIPEAFEAGRKTRLYYRQDVDSLNEYFQDFLNKIITDK